MTLLETIQHDTALKRHASTRGGEYCGPCPFCGGRDRFIVQPNHDGGRWWCRQCHKGGDEIAYLVEIGRLTPAQAYAARHGEQVRPTSATATPRATPAPEPTEPPDEAWQEAAWRYICESQERLWRAPGAKARDWLRRRGLSDETIEFAGLGYDPGRDSAWRCVTIPWYIGDDIWAVRRRFPAWSADNPHGPTGKFMMRKGSSGCGLYEADTITTTRPVVLVEGELDALSIVQEAGDLTAAVATGGIGQARRPRWIARLSMAPLVLVSFDAGAEAEPARRWWLDALPNARYWRPFWDDANGLLQANALRDWIAAGLV